jgi:MFS family permease
VALSRSHTSATVIAFAALLGVGQAINGTTWQAVVPSLVSKDDLIRATSIVQAGVTLAGIAAPALGGVLTGAYGTAVPLLVDAASFLLLGAVGVAVAGRRAGWRSCAATP